MTFVDKHRLTEGGRGALFGAIILFVVVTLAFAPFAYGDRTLASSSAEVPSLFPSGAALDPAPTHAYRGIDPFAAGLQTEPMFQLEHQEVIGEKVAPLWNPYVGYGEPLAANWQSQPFFPLTWLPIVNPSARAYNWYVILRFYVAALFAFLYLRFFVRFTAALAGGLAFGLTGYLVLFYNMPHVSVECLVPGLFFTIECLVRKPKPGTTVGVACMVAAVIFGGMPESAVLAFAFATAYAIVRIFSDELTRGIWSALIVRLVGATALGVGMSMCLLLPAYEFIKLSLNQHDPAMIGGAITGLYGEAYSFSFLPTYLAPLINGPPWMNIFSNSVGLTGLRGYFGVAQTYFALLAAFAIVAGTLQRVARPWSPGPFALVMVTLLIFKRFGNPLVNWFGALPGFNLINFPKYEEVLIGLCVAILAALGIEQLAAGKVSAVRAWFAAVVPLAVLTTIAWIDKPAFLTLTQHRGYYEGSLALGVLVLAGVAFIAFAAVSERGRRWLPQLAILAAIIIASEGVASYIVPLWYVVVAEAPISRNAANGAPYIDFVHSRTALDQSRFYGEDYLLAPEWSSAFDISDVVDLNAEYDRHYMKFLQAFLPTPPGNELSVFFTGAVPIEFDLPLEQRWLALSSIAYVGTLHTLGGDRSLLSLALASRPGEVSPTLRSGTWTISGSRRDAVFMHAPRIRYPAPVKIPKRAKVLRYGIGMDPGVWADPAAMCGEGVNFTVEIQDQRGVITTLGHRYIDPKHNAGDRRWFDFSQPIGRWAGQGATLLFTTAPGPSGITCADWALWSGVDFDVPMSVVSSPFRLVYDTAEANIYHFNGALPRLSLYTGAITAATDDAALALLTAPEFNPRTRAVITTDNQAARDAAAALGSAPGGVVAGQIDLYTSRHVHASFNAIAPSLAVLSDLAYPGWVAAVDGHGVQVIKTNYMFRGVLVPAGQHSLDFWYRPKSFSIGLAITIVSIVIAGLYLGWSAIVRKDRRRLV